jgi:hypothetical protein
VIVAEADWDSRPKSAASLADLFVKTVGGDAKGFNDVVGRQKWTKDKRALGAEFTE